MQTKKILSLLLICSSFNVQNFYDNEYFPINLDLDSILMKFDSYQGMFYYASLHLICPDRLNPIYKFADYLFLRASSKNLPKPSSVAKYYIKNFLNQNAYSYPETKEILKRFASYAIYNNYSCKDIEYLVDLYQTYSFNDYISDICSKNSIIEKAYNYLKKHGKRKVKTSSKIEKDSRDEIKMNLKENFSIPLCSPLYSNYSKDILFYLSRDCPFKLKINNKTFIYFNATHYYVEEDENLIKIKSVLNLIKENKENTIGYLFYNNSIYYFKDGNISFSKNLEDYGSINKNKTKNIEEMKADIKFILSFITFLILLYLYYRNEKKS